MRAYFAAFKRYKGQFDLTDGKVPFAILCALARGGVAALLALALRSLIDSVVNRAPESVMLREIALSVGCSALLGILGFATRWSVVHITQDMMVRLRTQFVDRVLHLHPQQVASLGRARIQSVALRDSDAVDSMTSVLFGIIVPGLLASAALVIVLLCIAPIFGALSIAMGLLLYLVGRQFRAGIDKNIFAYSNAFSSFSQSLLVTIERLLLVRVAGLEQAEMQARRRDIIAVGEVGRQTEVSIAKSAEFLGFVGNVLTVTLLGVGAALSLTGTSLENLLTVFVVLSLLRFHVAGAAGGLPDFRRGVVALQRTWTLMDEGRERASWGSAKFRFHGNISVREVSYAMQGRVLFEQVSLELKPGVCTVLTGPNGSGKTTLLNLILGLMKPSSGRLEADGHSYNEIDFDILREAMSFLPQNPVIFDGTVGENIRFGRPTATQREVEFAADLADASPLIANLPDGYDTQVGDEGAFLSGGEKQRIALARALLGRPRLLIMDEPSNHLDVRAVGKLVEGLARSPESPAILIVTHEEKLIAQADALFELRNGRLTNRSVSEAPYL